jgi:hypothetical protein
MTEWKLPLIRSPSASPGKATQGGDSVICIVAVVVSVRLRVVRVMTGAAYRAGIALAAATIAHSVALERMPLEDPSGPAFLSIFAVGCAAVVVLALGLVWTVLRGRVQRRSVARIVAELGEAPPPGSLESALARAIGDPELRIA